MLTPMRRRHKAMADAYYATLKKAPDKPSVMVSTLLEKALAAAGYKVVRIRELRPRGADEGVASQQAAGDSATP